MALVLTTAGKNTVLDSGMPSPVYLQLHTGDPTSAGTSAVSTITGRQSVALAAASSGNRTNGSGVTWSAPNGISGTETLSHATLWTASSGGTCLAYGTLTNSRIGVTSADIVNVPAGEVDVTLTDP
jgi:hypothetical protein